MSCRPLPPIPRPCRNPGTRTTCLYPKHLAWLALDQRLHANGWLKTELLNYLWDVYDHRLAMTFVDGQPACVVLAAEYGQLMAYTRSRFRRQGLATRTTRYLFRYHGLDLSDYNGSAGRRPRASQGFFNSLDVNFVP